ncbi:MAG: hypothetical protein JJT96_01250 [Opitutales bacterium]|nr:hypothetical protein [Opitutales bacterium]
MKRPSRTAIFLFLGSFATAIGSQSLIEENFSSLDAWDDLSTALSWAGQPASGSAFEIVGDTLQLSAAGIASVGLRPWESETRSRSFTALDRRFAEPLAHRTGTLVIEFRVRWHSLINEVRGEWNRIGITLVHDYPEGGLDLTRDDKVYDFSAEWWGRPAYQVRLRGSDTTGYNAATALLMYGGGYHPDGEFEIYYDNRGNPLWWLAGFSSTAGGSASNGGPSPGVGDPWPDNGWVRSSRGLASTAWQRFRYVVAPGYQELWINAADDGLHWVRDGFMPLPEEADAPATAPLYRYFESFEGIRLYLRGYENVSMDYLHASWVPEKPFAAEWTAQADGSARLAFPTLPGHRYWIEVSADLNEWQAHTGPWEGSGWPLSADLGPPAANEARFYRVRRESALTGTP